MKLVLKKKTFKYFQYNFTVSDRRWTTGEQKQSLELFSSGELKIINILHYVLVSLYSLSYQTLQETILLLFSTHVNQWPSDTSNILKFEKYIVEIHTSNIIIEKNHKADINSTGFILQSSRVFFYFFVCSQHLYILGKNYRSIDFKS